MINHRKIRTRVFFSLLRRIFFSELNSYWRYIDSLTRIIDVVVNTEGNGEWQVFIRSNVFAFCHVALALYALIYEDVLVLVIKRSNEVAGFYLQFHTFSLKIRLDCGRTGKRVLLSWHSSTATLFGLSTYGGFICIAGCFGHRAVLIDAKMLT